MNSLFNYFQIACLVLLLVLLFGKTLIVKIRTNISPFTLTKGKRPVHAALELSFFIGLVFWSLEVIMYAFELRFRIFQFPFNLQMFPQVPTWLGVLRMSSGVILISTGFVVFVLALIAFKNSWRVGIDEKTPGALITTGIFSISRNPIFLFIDLYFFGIFFINGTLIFLLFAIIAVLGLHYQILQEELFLEKQYGEEYQRYKTHTARYFGRQYIVGK